MAKAYVDYTIVDLIRLNGSFLCKDKDSVAVDEINARLKYISNVARMLNVDISRLSFIRLFADPSNELGVVDNKAANAIITKLCNNEINAEPLLVKNELGKNKLLTEFAGTTNAKIKLGTGLDYQVKYLKSKIKDNNDVICTYTRDIISLQSDVNIFCEKLVAFEKAISEGKDTRKNLLTVINEVEETTGCKFLSYKDGYLFLITPEIFVTHLTATISFGRFLFKIFIEVGQIKSYYCNPFWQNIIVSEYWHPHVNSNGSMCLGELQTAYLDAIKFNDLCSAIKIALRVLRSYNPGSPYLQFYNFNDAKTVRRNMFGMFEKLVPKVFPEYRTFIDLPAIAKVRIGDKIKVLSVKRSSASSSNVGKIFTVREFSGLNGPVTEIRIFSKEIDEYVFPDEVEIVERTKIKIEPFQNYIDQNINEELDEDNYEEDDYEDSDE